MEVGRCQQHIPENQMIGWAGLLEILEQVQQDQLLWKVPQSWLLLCLEEFGPSVVLAKYTLGNSKNVTV
jgi:hypothetical protein